MEEKGVIEITWYITDYCNLRCKHCYHENFSNKVDQSIDQIQLENKILKEIVELSQEWEVICVRFLGGEPMLHPRIFEFASYLKREIGCEIGIATNGLHFTDENIRKIREIGIDKIQVSLESSQKEQHEFYRGKETWENTLQGVKKIVDSGTRTGIRMTISKANLDKMDEFAKLGKDMNLNLVSFNKYIPDKYNTELLQSLSKKEHTYMLNKILELKQIYGDEFVVSEDPCLNDCYSNEIEKEFEKELQEDYPIGGCSAGLFSLIISKEGIIYPCTMLRLSVGDIRKESLINIWESENSILQKLRNRGRYLEGRCKECSSKLYCGGCRAAAYKMTGNFMGEDPFCDRDV
ncbi:MAG: radical SAM protein [Lachnospiraceae bacterium]|nr:radical SAM protein [Lachnospiraceae bacterium]